jgi:hypothetical protein
MAGHHRVNRSSTAKCACCLPWPTRQT